ncbi:coiled-coil domain-containing protein 68 isoform X2 [Xenopus laevis]|uniref:Coiled-coil domain-containing protein 68 isoform X2 n=1 Tax=Xenopus laevis TaxID=8355 RepID=A0A8J1L950_XENLA|nr:coiled-coil domain-containing protein 68 isoform X2 [Xenopus laevis]
MTSLTVVEHTFPRKDNESKRGDDIFYLYGSTFGHISEETEYVRKIRGTLEKIHGQLFKNEKNTDYVSSNEDQNEANLQQNGTGSYGNSSERKYIQIIDNLEEKELQLVEAHKENGDLQIKLEATREAGAGALRNATRKLYENYSKKSEERRKSHEEEKQKLQASAADHEKEFKQSIGKLHTIAEKIQDKHERITELKNLMERMEEEKSILLEKKRLLEKEISRRMSLPTNINGCGDTRAEISTVEEQISHLQQLMMSQHQFLHSLIQESEELKNRLKEQDITIGDLKERISLLEHQNKELKSNVDHWSQDKTKVSKGTFIKGVQTIHPPIKQD